MSYQLPLSTLVTLALCLASCQATILDMTRTFDNSSRRWPAPHSPFHLKTILAGMQPGGFWLQFEDVESGIHVGTHMDAPRHFCRDCWTIDQIPVERLVARPAVMIDIRQKAAQTPDTTLNLDDVKAYESKYGEIPRGAVIVQCTGWADKYDDTLAYLGNTDSNITNFHWPSFGVDAVEFLIQQRGIYGIAADTLSVDSGYAHGFPTHIYYSKYNVFSLENVDKTCDLPPSGAQIHVFPQKVKNASGGHTRVVAVWDTDAASSGPHDTLSPMLSFMMTALMAFVVIL